MDIYILYIAGQSQLLFAYNAIHLTALSGKNAI